MASHTPLTNAQQARSPEEMDRLLTSFFQAAMPKTWPGAPLVEAQPSSHLLPVPHGSGSASRWALTASVALLMGVCWYAGSSATTPQAGTNAKQKTDETRARAGDGVILDEMAKQKALTESDRLSP